MLCLDAEPCTGQVGGSWLGWWMVSAAAISQIGQFEVCCAAHKALESDSTPASDCVVCLITASMRPGAGELPHLYQESLPGKRSFCIK